MLLDSEGDLSAEDEALVDAAYDQWLTERVGLAGTGPCDGVDPAGALAVSVVALDPVVAAGFATLVAASASASASTSVSASAGAALKGSVSVVEAAKAVVSFAESVSRDEVRRCGRWSGGGDRVPDGDAGHR